MGFFQQCFQLILQTDFVTRPLILCARECTPQALFGVRYKAQDQFLGNQPLHQTFSVSKIFLAPPPPAVGQGLRQMQASGHVACVFPLLTDWLPIPLQHSP